MYKRNDIQVLFLSILFMFCMGPFVSLSQEAKGEELVNAIQSNISAGYLFKVLLRKR